MWTAVSWPISESSRNENRTYHPERNEELANFRKGYLKMNKLVQITPKDLVAVALMPLQAGETIDYGTGKVTLLQDLPMGHKVALRATRVR